MRIYVPVLQGTFPEYIVQCMFLYQECRQNFWNNCILWILKLYCKQNIVLQDTALWIPVRSIDQFPCNNKHPNRAGNSTQFHFSHDSNKIVCLFEIEIILLMSKNKVIISYSNNWLKWDKWKEWHTFFTRSLRKLTITSLMRCPPVPIVKSFAILFSFAFCRYRTVFPFFEN